jgi:anti-sigma regulatory factor (Ser/Thr protein kinase)
VIWTSETARAVRDADGRLLGFEGTVEDITRRKQAEEERAQALAALEKAREDLEVRVRLRTAALAETNAALRAEIAERRRAEAELAEANRELMEAHREMAETAAEKKRFYREVIRCVTRDRFHLVDAADIPDPGPAVLDLPLGSLRDDGALRKQLRQVAANAGMAHEAVEDLVLAVGEAATNAIKHAKHGRCTVYRRADSLAVRISDQGAGIRADDLPASILLPGFSKAVSLGMGYTLMLELVDRIWLATGPEGTIVQLEKWITAPKEPSSKPSLVTAWDSL